MCELDPDFQLELQNPSVFSVDRDNGTIIGKAPGSASVIASIGSKVRIEAPIVVEDEQPMELGRSPAANGGSNEDGSYPYSQWARIDGDWYHFDRSGYMQTGWLKLGKGWYLLEELWPNGRGLAAESQRRLVLSEPRLWRHGHGMEAGRRNLVLPEGSGAMATGWQKVGGSW